MAADGPRRIRTAELLSIGSELTVGETRDTNAGELARSLTEMGVRVTRLTAVPDDLETVTEAVRGGLDRADLVVSTGGLGPTPDDLTREAIAAAFGETPTVDAGLEAWLRELWQRRGLPFLDLNLKQAWLIPSCVALPNPNGTAPGWFAQQHDGRIVVALPGPPREMRPMWADHALPRLRAIGLGADVASRTYRLAGIGESLVADTLGEDLLRSTNPVVATYARVEAVDVRISAVGDATGSAESLVEAAAAAVLARVGDHIWATGQTTWSQAIGERLEALGWTLAIVEIGTGGSLDALLGDVPWLRFAESVALDAPAAAVTVASENVAPDATAAAVAVTMAADDVTPEADRDADDAEPADDLRRSAQRAREVGGASVGLAVRARERAGDTAVSIAISTPRDERRVRRIVFLGGSTGRSRAALAAAAVLLETLR